MRSKLIIPSSGVVELYDDASISLTYQVADIKDPQKRHADYSKTITVPGSHNNNQMFQHIFSIGIDRLFDPNKKAPCQLVIDSQTVMKGFMRLRNIVKTDMKVDYEIEITGRTADLFISMGDNYVKDLPWSDLDHTMNQANQIASWSATIGSNYVYPFIDYGKSTISTLFNVNDFYPAVYVKEVWDRIFMATGFQYTSTSGFFTSTLFKSLIMPFNSDSLRLTQTQIDNRIFRASRATSAQSIAVTFPSNSYAYADIIFNNETTSPNQDIGGVYNNSTGVWTCNASGYYNVSTSFNIKAQSDVATGVANSYITVYTWPRIIDVTNTPRQIDMPGSSSQMAIPTASTGTQYAPITQTCNVSTTAPLYISSGTQVKVQLAWQAQIVGTATGNINSSAVEVQTGGIFFTKADSEIKDGDTVTMANAIDQKLKCKDFVNSIIKMFNLYVEYDKDTPNKLIIDPRNSYYTTTVQDWTQKRDLSRELEIIPMGALQARKYVFSYREDKDWLNELYTKETNEVFGQKNLDIDNDFLVSTQKEEVIFSPTPFDSSSSAASNITPISNDDRYYSCLFKRDSNGVKAPTASNPRILYYGGVRGCKPWQYRSDILLTTSGVTNYPYAGHLDNPINPTFDLSWNMPVKVYYDPAFNATYTNNNLYNAYWSQEMGEITDKNSSIVTGYFKLSPYDISLIDFRHVYRFDFQNFRLNKIYDYNPLQDGFTKCEFIKIKQGIAFTGYTGILNGANDGLISGIPIPNPKPRPKTGSGGLGGSATGRMIIGDNNYVADSAIGVLVTGRYNSVGENARNVTILNSSGCVVPGDVSEVFILNSSGVTVTESNTMVVNNVSYSGGGTSSTYATAISAVNPTGTSSATGVMQGVGTTITPLVSGNLLVTFSGSLQTAASTTIGVMQIKYGTGTPPSNGDAPTGTSIGGYQEQTNTNASAITPFSMTAIATGLNKGVSYWFDIHLLSGTGAGVTNVIKVTSSIVEI
ncbi:MAG: hypothetical protein NUV80_03045 [Candidatus Berkelbacteria bacterium]|nr:hypothetical protein [Candidatus Berkelbacteria bacterium]